jgi:sugar lactone lactonase YvrE
LAGGSLGRADDGAGSAAGFNQPVSLAVDSAGNLYVADRGNNTIRKVTPVGTNWVVTTLAGLAQLDLQGNPCCAGSADGTGKAARFNQPSSVAVDRAGNVYVADSGNNTIRKVTPAGVVTTLAGQAQFDRFGETVGGNTDGTGINARFNFSVQVWTDHPDAGVAVDGDGTVYVADTYNHAIRKVTPEGVVTTLAGDSSIVYGSPLDIQKGVDGVGAAARFSNPSSLAVDAAGNVYVGDSVPLGSGTIRKVTPTGAVTTLAGSFLGADGTGIAAQFSLPTGVAVDRAGNIYVADSGRVVGLTVRKVTPTGTVTTLAGLAGNGGSEDGTGSTARFGGIYEGDGGPCAVAVDRKGNVYVADVGNGLIRKVTPAGVVTTLAGMAGGGSGVAVDSEGNIYVADTYNHTIRKATPAGTNWLVTTLAGDSSIKDQYGSAVGGDTDGTGSAARFNYPRGLAVDSTGNIYVADYGNNTIRKVTPTGAVTTLAGDSSIKDQYGYPAGGYTDGTGSAARFEYPSAVAVDGVGNVYVADSGNNTIRKVTAAGAVTTLAGLAQFDDSGYPCCGGSADGTGSVARFNHPFGVAVDNAGDIYVADLANGTIRKGYSPRRLLSFGASADFTDGNFGFVLTGPDGRLVVVEVSPDLVNWRPLWTNTLAGALYLTDPQSAASSHRFYRAQIPQPSP